jgi:hypothetical protein
MECSDLFWHEFYRGAGISLSILLPLALAFFGFMLGMTRLQDRHQERMEEARQRDYQARVQERYRVLPGGQSQP